MEQKTSVPVVSVIVPMYNVEKYLRECLDSVVNQTLKNIEIICVDDGSPDRSGEIADGYAAKYSNLRVVRKANGGLSSARNAGLDAATGRYVYFLDSDDFLDLNTLSELSSKADGEALDIVYFNTVSFFENKEIREKNLNYLSYYNRKGDYSGVYTGQQMFAKMRENKEFFGSACLLMIRRSLIEENGIRFYNGIIHEDNLFTFQCAMLASRVGYIDKAYYHRRVHGDSIMTTRKSMRNVEGYVVSYAEMLSFLHNREIDKSAAKCISEYLYYSMYRNACTIYRGLDADGKKQELAHGDFCAQHLLDLVKKNVAYEVDNEKLRQKIKQLENNAQAAVSSRRRRQMGYIPRRIKGGIQCVRDHGLRYTIALALRKLSQKLPRISSDNKLVQGITWPFRRISRFFKTMYKYGVTYHFRAFFAKCAMKKQQDTPRVSVIMPVYNAAEFLERGLDTLKNQTLKNIEVICVDDGSTDRSLEILHRYAEEDSRFKVLQQKNQFAGAARNLGLSHAKGEYVIFLDSDDFFATSLCEEAYVAGRAHRADVVLFAAKHFDNATGRVKEAKWLLQAQKAPLRQPFNYRNCPDVLYHISSPAPWTKMFRRAFVEKTGLQFQTLHNSNDLFFTYSAIAMADRIVTLDRPLVFYRVGLSTNLQTKKKKYPFCFCEAYQAWHEKLVELGILETVKKSYVNVALSGCLHNLRSNADPEVKRQVFDKLKNEVLKSLEIPGHQESFYLVNKNYKDMLLILNGSYEEYMDTQT